MVHEASEITYTRGGEDVGKGKAPIIPAIGVMIADARAPAKVRNPSCVRLEPNVVEIS